MPEPDPELRDTERVPLPEGEDPADDEGVPASVRAFFEREVEPHVPDAWIDTARRDHKDGLVGHVGYEINFNRYFYRYVPPPAAGGDRGGHPGHREGHPEDAERHVDRAANLTVNVGSCGHVPTFDDRSPPVAGGLRDGWDAFQA